MLEEVTIEGSMPTLEEFREYGNTALPWSINSVRISFTTNL